MAEQASFRITNATAEDAPLVYAIMQAAFEEYRGVLDPPSGVHAETVEAVVRAMAEGGAVLAWLGETAVGSARYAFHEQFCYIGRVSVLPAYRGRGIATAMMQYIEAIARARGCPRLKIDVRLVLADNIGFYERLGYQVIETYQHPKGAGMIATMVKPL